VKSQLNKVQYMYN